MMKDEITRGPTDSICRFCHRNMRDETVVTCSHNSYVVFPNGKVMDSVPHAKQERCHDCFVMESGFHHPGCDMERCPLCGRQLISCGCLLRR